MAYKPLKKRYMTQESIDGPLSKMINKAVEERVSSMLKNTEEDLGMVVEGSKAAKKAEKAEKKAAKEAEKERKQLLKRFGGDEEKMNAYLERKAQREAEKEDYLFEKRESLARLGKGYNVMDEDGEYQYVSPSEHAHYNTDTNHDGVISREERWASLHDATGKRNVEIDEELVDESAVTRDQLDQRAAWDKMTPEEQEAYKQQQLAKLQEMKKSKVEGGQATTTLPKLKYANPGHMLNNRTMSFRKKR